MTKLTARQQAWELATGQYGYVGVAEATEAGIPNIELVKLAARGRLRHVAYGLYHFDEMPPTPWDQYFEAVRRVGGDAHLTGESVLAIHGLALVNPQHIWVGTSRLVRAQIPDWMKVVREHVPADEMEEFEGIPVTTVARAIRDCAATVMRERLLDAVAEADRQGLLATGEAARLRRELRRS
ncbi:MAG: hypothetical protein ACOYMR_07025 [Ilumatobacteraceae bacterium]